MSVVILWLVFNDDMRIQNIGYPTRTKPRQSPIKIATCAGPIGFRIRLVCDNSVTAQSLPDRKSNNCTNAKKTEITKMTMASVEAYPIMSRKKPDWYK